MVKTLLLSLLLSNAGVSTSGATIDTEKSKYVPGKGLEIKSKDNKFSLATRLRAQFLYTNHYGYDSHKMEHGLQIRRARLQFKGHFFNKHNKFKTEFAMSPKDVGYDGTTLHRTPILDWYLSFDYNKSASFRIGQYKVPYSRQRVVSSGDLQFVDRTVANKEYNLDRDIGFDLYSKDFLGKGKMKYNLGVYLGEGRDQYNLSSYEMMYIARWELLPMGLFDDYKEADLKRTKKPKISFGVAYAFVHGSKKDKGIIGKPFEDKKTKVNFYNVTADVVFKYKGVSLFGDFYYREGKSKKDIPLREGWGWSTQLGYVIPKVPLELAARYAQVKRKNSNSAVKNVEEPGTSISYYFYGHPMKLQLDYYRTMNNLQKSGDTIRLQLQASF